MERVDKAWRSKGLDRYSTDAILGTLAHYGIEIDEPGFAKLAKDRYPLGIAEEWLPRWRGTGQFSEFPVAAADELWRRTEKGRVAPAGFALAVVQLMTALEAMREDAPDAPVGERFKAVEDLRQKVGVPPEDFLGEVRFHIGDWVEKLSHLAEALARDGHVEDAADFAAIEELVFPERAGTSKAVVRGLGGEKEAAVRELEAIAGSAERGGRHRLAAADGLARLDELEKAERHAIALLELAEKEHDLHFGLDVAGLIARCAEKLGPSAERERLLARIEALAEAHSREHKH